MIWPISVAPYVVHLIVLPKKVKKQGADDDGLDPVSVAEQLYQEFQSSGIEILFDDRQESPGVKFNDADLIGIPIRLTVSERALQAGGIEVKRRDQKDKNIIPTDNIYAYVKTTIAELQSNVDESVVTIPFEE